MTVWHLKPLWRRFKNPSQRATEMIFRLPSFSLCLIPLTHIKWLMSTFLGECKWVTCEQDILLILEFKGNKVRAGFSLCFFNMQDKRHFLVPSKLNLYCVSSVVLQPHDSYRRMCKNMSYCVFNTFFKHWIIADRGINMQMCKPRVAKMSTQWVECLALLHFFTPQILSL